MNYIPFKMLIVLPALICVFAFPVATTITPPVYARSDVYSDVAQRIPDRPSVKNRSDLVPVIAYGYYPQGTWPSYHPQGTWPGYYPPGTLPGQYPGPVMPHGYHPPYPHTHPATLPSQYPGPVMFPGYYPRYPQTHHYPGTWTGYYPPGTLPGQYPGPVMPHGYHPPYPHTHPLY